MGRMRRRKMVALTDSAANPAGNATIRPCTIFVCGIGFEAERLCLTAPRYPAVENRELSGRQIFIEANTHASPGLA